jgi:SWIM zinc finger
MSLDLTAYDDAALEALAPKGLVRRARRDFEAGVAAVRERTGSTAVVETEGQTVNIDARGPKGARCTCPAGGICRHILVAVMAVNAAAPAAAPQAVETGASAADEICALSQAELTAFAGADWTTAVGLAAASTDSAVVESGRNCTVELAGAPTGVTFIAGLGLKGAAFKGAKSRRRVVVAASAILMRQKRGLAVDVAEAELTPAKDGVAQDYLDDAAQKLTRGVRIVLKAASPVAADILFDLAISARAEAAPRLTAKLRGLAKQAGRAATRDIQFEPDAFLAEAAATFALIAALKRQPTDSALTGAVRRDYEAVPAFDLWMLGATTWRTDAGARGLTLHGFAPEERRWRSVSIARGAGMDPTFDPRAAYQMPLWGAGVASATMGKVLHLAKPLVAADDTLATTLAQPAALASGIRNLNTLIDVGAAAVSWADMPRCRSCWRRRATAGSASTTSRRPMNGKRSTPAATGCCSACPPRPTTQPAG